MNNHTEDSDYHVGCGPDPNGVAVWNWNDTKHEDGSEKFIAHINHDREITYLEENLPEDVIAEIKGIAQGDWKEVFAIEMSEFDYNPKPPPNLYLEQIAKWLENETGIKQQIVHTGEGSGIRYIDHDSEGDATNMTIIADADIDIHTISWSADYGIGLNTDKTDNANGEKIHVILWSADEVSKDERGYFMDAVGARNGVLVIANPEIKVTDDVVKEMMAIGEEPNQDRTNSGTREFFVITKVTEREHSVWAVELPSDYFAHEISEAVGGSTRGDLSDAVNSTNLQKIGESAIVIKHGDGDFESWKIALPPALLENHVTEGGSSRGNLEEALADMGLEGYVGHPSPFVVHLENIHNPNTKYFELPFPTTAEDLQPFLAESGIFDWRDIKIYDITSDVDGLGEKLYTTISDNGMSSSTLNELNYLASKLQEMFARGEYGGREIFLANIEANRNCETVADMINLTFIENLNQFDVQPAFSAYEYGDFQIDMVLGDTHAEIFHRLNDSENPEERAFAAYLEKLEKHVDRAALGQTIAKEEGGVFTKQGYLLGDDSDVTRLFHGAQDIPAEYHLLPQSSVPSLATEYVMKIDDVNIAETIVKLHAVGCRNMEYASDNVKNLFNAHKLSTESTDYNPLVNQYVLILNRSDIFIAPAIDICKNGSELSKLALTMAGQVAKSDRSDIKIFAVRANNAYSDDRDTLLADGKDLRGDFIELSPQSLSTHILRHTVMPNRVDVLREDGTQQPYNLFEWGQMLGQQNGKVEGTVTYHYPDATLIDVGIKFSQFFGNHETRSQADSFEAHLPKLCNLYGVAPADTDSPQPTMIAVANEAAKEILARGDADVYRLSVGDETNGGVVKLDTFEALRPMCFAEYRDTAIKLEDAGGLGKWAEQKVSDISRKLEKEAGRETHKKSHGGEL